MAKTEAPRVTFHCGPCREAIQFFNVRAAADAQRFFRSSDDAKVILKAHSQGHPADVGCGVMQALTAAS
jgi:hypothetical protein